MDLSSSFCASNRHRGDSNPCGQSPMDFESISLTARTHCLRSTFGVDNLIRLSNPARQALEAQVGEGGGGFVFGGRDSRRPLARGQLRRRQRRCVLGGCRPGLRQRGARVRPQPGPSPMQVGGGRPNLSAAKSVAGQARPRPAGPRPRIGPKAFAQADLAAPKPGLINFVRAGSPQGSEALRGPPGHCGSGAQRRGRRGDRGSCPAARCSGRRRLAGPRSRGALGRQ